MQQPRSFASTETVLGKLYILGGGFAPIGYTTEWLDLTLKNTKRWTSGFKLNTTLHGACSVKVSPEEVVIIEAEPMPILMIQYNLVTGAAKRLPTPPTKVSLNSLVEINF